MVNKDFQYIDFTGYRVRVVAQEVSAVQPLTEPCYCLNGGECVTVSDNAENPSPVQCKCKQGQYLASSTCSAFCYLYLCFSSEDG